MSSHAAPRPRDKRYDWLFAALSMGTVVMVLGVLVFAVRGCDQWMPSQQGRRYSLGTRIAAPSTDESKQTFADAHAAFIAHIASLGFVEDSTYVPGTIRHGFHTPGEVEHMYVSTVDGTEVQLFTRLYGGHLVGMESELSYLATGTRAEVASTVAKIEQLRADLISWMETYEREHRMPH